jgi:hypothetical protein
MIWKRRGVASAIEADQIESDPDLVRLCGLIHRLSCVAGLG